ncbi:MULTISPECIES: pentapeptide repeat-containing protein [Paraburkholderia]|uniref:Pentapeptide repeat-containing protein n=1 Tax=Paraburkholderia guartelaensis TaxID=2546446 RepID=A0ABU9S3F2_9BURK
MPAAAETIGSSRRRVRSGSLRNAQLRDSRLDGADLRSVDLSGFRLSNVLQHLAACACCNPARASASWPSLAIAAATSAGNSHCATRNATYRSSTCTGVI